MIVLVVNEDRYLFNDEVCDKQQDEAAEGILAGYDCFATVEWDDVRDVDVRPRTINELINN